MTWGFVFLNKKISIVNLEIYIVCNNLQTNAKLGQCSLNEVPTVEWPKYWVLGTAGAPPIQ